MSTVGWTVVLMAFGLVGQAPASAGAAALEFMKDSARIYQIQTDEDEVLLRLQPEPVFRLGAQGNNVLDGAIFFWTDAIGRPEAAAQIWLYRTEEAPEGKWLHEFTTLSTRLLHARQDGRDIWSPRAPGIEFQPLVDAPKPAETPAQRLRQLRALATDFKAWRGVWASGSLQGWNELRLLPTPIARYGKPDGPVRDGALFAFVKGTDPEVFLLFEERPGPEGSAWHYALAPMSCFPVKATGKGRITWELSFRPPENPRGLLYSRFYQLAKPRTP